MHIYIIDNRSIELPTDQRSISQPWSQWKPCIQRQLGQGGHWTGWPLRPTATPNGHLSRPCPSSCGKSCIHAAQTCTSRSQAYHQAPAVRQSPGSCGCHEAMAGQAVSRQVGQHPGRLRQAVPLPLPCPLPCPSPCLCPCLCLALPPQ